MYNVRGVSLAQNGTWNEVGMVVAGPKCDCFCIVFLSSHWVPILIDDDDDQILILLVFLVVDRTVIIIYMGITHRCCYVVASRGWGENSDPDWCFLREIVCGCDMCVNNSWDGVRFTMLSKDNDLIATVLFIIIEST